MRDCHEFHEVIYMPLDSCVWVHRTSQLNAVDYSVVQFIREESRVEATLTKYNEIFSCHSVYSRTCPCHDRVTRNKYPLNIRYKDRVGENCRNTCELQIWLWKGCPLQLPRLTWQMPKDGGYPESQYTTTRSDEYFRIILKWVTSWTSGCHKHNLRSHFGAYTM